MTTSLVLAYERKKHQLPTAQCHGMKEFQVSFIVILARKYIACLLYSSKIICMNNRCGLKPVGFRIWKMLTPGTVWQIRNVFILARQKWQEFYRKCHRLPLPLHLPWIQNCSKDVVNMPGMNGIAISYGSLAVIVKREVRIWFDS